MILWSNNTPKKNDYRYLRKFAILPVNIDGNYHWFIWYTKQQAYTYKDVGFGALTLTWVTKNNFLDKNNLLCKK
jgi:hypothetical protein